MLGKQLVLRGNPRGRLNALLSRDGSTVANYKMGVGLTGTTNASAWANQIGAAGPLLQATGANQPAIQADGSLLFDGTNDFMAAAFTLVQPETIYIVFKQISWTSNEYIFDGNTAITTVLFQITATPELDIYAGFQTAANTGLAIGAYGVVTVVFNGASSSLQVNSNAATTGNAGAQNSGGFTLGGQGGGTTLFSNIQVKEVIIRNVADSAATQAQIQGLLKAIHRTP